MINIADTVALRCYIDRSKTHSTFTTDSTVPNRSIVLVFDTETTVDEHQNLLFGSCGVWVNGVSSEFYIFYNEDIVKENDLEIVKSYAVKHKRKVLSRKQFVEKVFYPFVYTARASCVGFNLPFDLSRLAIRFAKSRKYANGFSLKLSKNLACPDVVVKSINSKAAFIEFTRPPAAGKKVSATKNQHYRGCFIDLKTAAFALTNNVYSLDKALRDFGCNLYKLTPDGHGKITEEYIEYNVNDTLATYELYQKVVDRYSLYSLKKEVSKLFSPASIGKAYLEKRGVKSFHVQNPSFPAELLGKAMSTYYGGRTELRVRKTPVRVAYLDATSMYPTVYALLGMDGFLKAAKIVPKETTAETRALLDNITINDIVDKQTWEKLTTICKIRPDNDILPVRSKYASKDTYNIGINYVESADGTCLWYTLPDLIASKLLSGKTPIIEEAVTFSPTGIQQELRNIEILEGMGVAADADLVKRIIEERIAIKQGGRALTDDASRRQAELAQSILKIIANSVSYGIFIEINTEDKKEEDVAVYGLDTFHTVVSRAEVQGKAFNPIMATFITAGARLLLAAAEMVVCRNNGSAVYFDTDSVLCKPECADLVQRFFRPLNPYDKDVEVFKVEDYEGEDGKKHPLDNIWFYGISSKRYVLYNRNETTGEIKIRKYSSHGLGHLQDIDEEQWWKDILTMHYHPEVRQDVLAKYGSSGKFAVSRLTVSNYSILSRFDHYNNGKSFARRIKPYNFITVGTGYHTDSKTGEPIIPLLPFIPPIVNGKANGKFKDIPYMPFVDYKTCATHSGNTEFYWKPLSEVFEGYVDHPEAKFDGDAGLLHRKQLNFDRFSIHYIGKESNELERAEVLGVDEEDYTHYDNAESIIMQNKKLFLKMRPRDAASSGLMKQPFWNIKKALRAGDLSKLKQKTKKKLLGAIKSHASYRAQ